MRTVIVGNRQIARYLLDHAIETNWNVVGAIAAAGRLAAAQANFTPFDEIITTTDATLIETGDINDEETMDQLETLEPDLCICPAWSQIISKRILDIPTYGFIGVHSSRLPEGRGGAPVNWSIAEGDSEIYVTFFKYAPEIDAGDVYLQRAVPIESRDDIQTVFEKISALSCELLDDLYHMFNSGSQKGDPQDLEAATYRPRRQPQDGLVDWSLSPSEQYDWIRALTRPYPGAYTFYDRKKVLIWSGSPVDRPVEDSNPGEVLAVVDGEGIDLCSGTGALRVQRVQPAGKPAMWADKWAPQSGLESGDVLGTHHAPPGWLCTGIRGPNGGTTFDTNLTDENHGTVKCIVQTPARERTLSVEASLDGEPLERTTLSGQGRLIHDVNYSLDSHGISTLEISFNTQQETIDQRYLKIYRDQS
jgi:methionyl-tRNA formyltransferase